MFIITASKSLESDRRNEVLAKAKLPDVWGLMRNFEFNVLHKVA